MSTVALLCAMDKELESFIVKYNAKRVGKGKIYEAKIAENTVYASVCGIGKVNAALNTQHLIDLYSPDAVINCGVAGGLNENLSVLDTVVANSLQYHDFRPLSLLENDETLKTSLFECDGRLVSIALGVCKKLRNEGKIGNYMSGKAVCGDCFVESDEEVERLRRDFGAVCVEMEGAAIAQVCIVNNVKFLAVRSISDFADNGAELSYEDFVNRAAEQAVLVVGAVISEII